MPDGLRLRHKRWRLWTLATLGWFDAQDAGTPTTHLFCRCPVPERMTTTLTGARAAQTTQARLWALAVRPLLVALAVMAHMLVLGHRLVLFLVVAVVDLKTQLPVQAVTVGYA